MFGINDLFQWERFVTPTVIKVFYWLAVVISVLLGLAGAVSSLTTMALNPFVGMIFFDRQPARRLHGGGRWCVLLPNSCSSCSASMSTSLRSVTRDRGCGTSNGQRSYSPQMPDPPPPRPVIGKSKHALRSFRYPLRSGSA